MLGNGNFLDNFYQILNITFSLQTSFATLDEVIKVTNRRVNAIEHVIIPRYERTVRLSYFVLFLTHFRFRTLFPSWTRLNVKNFSDSKKFKVKAFDI